jgi:DsbC/DsbD-like thiol-disulfide interchange protein
LRSLRHPVFLFLALTLLRADCANAQSQSLPPGTVRLVAENPWIQAGQSFTLGLHFSLEKDWHMYWINPGDSGEPPRVTWKLPPGVTSGPIQWPVPEKLGSSTIVDYGYKREVTLLVPMRAATKVPSEEPLTITAKVSVLICKDICIPGKTQVTLTLPVRAQAPPIDPAAGELFTKARVRLPQPPPLGWKLTRREQDDSFVLTVEVGRHVTQAYFYPLAESQIKNAPRQLFTAEASGFRLELRKSDQLTKRVTRLRGVLQLDNDRAYRIDSPVVPAGEAAAPTPPG